MKQLPALATLVPHVLVSAKSPLAATLVIFKGEPPMLFKVTGWGALLVPTT
jgi:hypothetical protein